MFSTYQTIANTVITTTKADIQAAFTEWDRRYREDPEKFLNEAARLLNPSENEYTYGEAALPYFLSILETVSGD